MYSLRSSILKDVSLISATANKKPLIFQKSGVFFFAVFIIDAPVKSPNPTTI